MKKFFLFIFLISIFLHPVYGQQLSLSIDPPIIQTIIKPGKSIMVAYNVKNYGDPTYLQAKVVSFEPKDNLGNIRLKKEIEGPIRFSLDNSQINLERPFFLKNGEKQQILLRIKVPENTHEGDYYYTLLIETIAQGFLNNISSTQSKMTIGSNILLTVTNSGITDIKPKIVFFDVLTKIKIFGKKTNLFDSFDKVPVVLILENKGKNFITPEGEITVKNNFGQKYTYQIIPKNILSESQRLIETYQSSKENQEKNPISSFILSGFLFGKYTISAKIYFGENSSQIFGKTTFFAFPFKLSLAIITIILIISGFLHFKNKENN